jgi:hypothetical protein
MSFVDPESGVVIPSTLELFDTAPTDMSIQAMEEIPYRPNTTFTPSSGDIRFEIPGNAEEFIVPNLTSMTFGLRVILSGGGDIGAAHNVGIINNAAHSVFSDCTVTLGNQVVSSDPCYAYTAMATNLLSYGNDAKESWLSNALYFKDTAGQMEEMLNANAANGNRGLNKRSAYFANSAVVPCRIRLTSSVFNVDKHFPSLLDMKVVLARTKPEFYIMAPTVAAQGAVGDENYVPPTPPNFRVEIIDPILWVTKAKIFPPLAYNILQKLSRQPMKYNISRHVTRPITLGVGLQSHTIDNVTTGQLPKRLIFGFVRSEAFNGSYARNPFNFQHLNLNHAAVYVNGTCHPLTPFRPTYGGERQNWLREYNSLFDSLGIHYGNSGIDINRDDYPLGYCLYGFDLTPNWSASVAAPVNLDKSGSVRIEFQLSEALTTAYSCIVFTEFDNIITIDNDRNVFVNYSK